MNANKPYDLEERTFEFARDIRLFIKKLPKHFREAFFVVLITY